MLSMTLVDDFVGEEGVAGERNSGEGVGEARRLFRAGARYTAWRPRAVVGRGQYVLEEESRCT